MDSLTSRIAPAAGFTAVLSWVWEIWYPEIPMTAPVAAGLMLVIVPVAHWVIAWLPSPYERR